MNIKKIIGVPAAIMFLSGIVFMQAQSKPNLVQGKSYLIQLDCARKLNRAVYQTVTQWCKDISFVRSSGKNVDEYVKYISKLSTSSWDVTKKFGIRGFVAGLYANGQLYENYLFEVLEESDDLIKVRANRPYALYFEDNLTLFGVKIDEYERCRRIFNQEIAAYLGYSYSEKIEAGWNIITVTHTSEKK